MTANPPSRLLLALLLLLPIACPAYVVLLDIDTDGDPSTLNEHTGASSAVVRVVLQPTEADEWIQHVVFGLGGTCLMCSYTDPDQAYYGTGWDLSWNGTVPDFPLLSGYGPTCSLSYLCQGNPGYHCWWEADAAGFILEQPIFIGTFNAWVAEPIHPGCPLPPSDLMAFTEYGGPPGNAILLADPDLAAGDGPTPAALVLDQNHPNPFNPSTTIGFTLAHPGAATLSIHDATGRRVDERDLGVLAAGHHQVNWRGVDAAGRAIPSGVYFYRVTAGGRSQTRRMVLLR